MQSTNARPTDTWNAAELFGLYNPEHGDFSCKGWAPSKNRRCWNPPIDRIRTTRILDQLSLREPDERTMRAQLLAAAQYSCCKRYHQDQAKDVAEEWYPLVRDLRVTRDRARREQETMRADRRALVAEQETLRTEQEALRTEQEALRTEQEALRTEQEALRVGQQRLQQQLDATSLRPSTSRNGRSQHALSEPPFPASSTESEQHGRETNPTRSTRSETSSAALEIFSPAISSTQELRALTGRTTDRTTTSSTTSSSRASVFSTSSGVLTPSSTDSSDSSRSASSIPSTSSSIPSTTSTSLLDTMTASSSTTLEQFRALQGEVDRLRMNRCLTAHVIRRPLTEDCAICYEGLFDTALGDLVWCKSQCGRSVHKECWEHWSRESTSPARCVHCRTQWASDCEHDGMAPPLRVTHADRAATED